MTSEAGEPVVFFLHLLKLKKKIEFALREVSVMVLMQSVYICVDWEKGGKLRRGFFLIAFPLTEP